MVLAISDNAISELAYQPEYPGDIIHYDVNFLQTEVTEGPAFGRITYRKDNQGNEFDYDFREVLFKRYDAYFSEQVYGGTVSISISESSPSLGAIVTGVDTNFTNFSTGEIIGVLNVNNNPIINYYEIVSIADDTNMVVAGNVIRESSESRLVDANLLEGMSWKQNNIPSNTASVELPTFGDINECFNNTSTNTAAYTVWNENTFLLPNNVFKGGSVYRENSFANNFRNNTFNTSCDSNRVTGSFYNNIFDNDFDNNIINDDFYDNIVDCDFQFNVINGEFYNNHFGDEDGEDFDYNTINGSFYQNFYTGENDFEYNTIKGSFYNNIILDGFSKNTLNGFYDNVVEDSFNNNQIGESFNTNRIYSSFNGNSIGIEFYDNTIHSGFYENTIDDYFRYNTIGDSGNSSNFDFRRNKIGKDFQFNAIRQDFEDNQIGNSFTYNIANGDFEGNVIGNDFYQNVNIGYAFRDNHIGNNFNNNELIGDYFQNNHIGNEFYSNSVSYNFRNNQIGNTFENNNLGNDDYFNWDNTGIENLDNRTYDNFYSALYGDDGEAVGNVILGKELIMHDTVNNQYHKVKFTQWTQNGNGSGFSYERTKVWPTEEPTVYFTKKNYEDIVDVIVEGSLEIARSNNGGAIYNIADEGNWNSNVSPVGTEWNSIYTQNNNGSGFEDNIIANNFKGNLILEDFSTNSVKPYVFANEFLGDVYSNEIGSYTFENDFSGEVSGNKWADWFSSNEIGLNFSNNTFGSSVYNNNIADDFQNNEIGNGFGDNIIGEGFGFGSNETRGNKIGNNFNNNNIGEYFYNNTIPDNFFNNTVGYYFQWNVVNTNIDNTDFTLNYGIIEGFTYTSAGTGGATGAYSGLTGSVSEGPGSGANFIAIVSGGTASSVTLDSISTSNQYSVNDTITILGTSIGGVTGVIDGFSSDAIGKTGADGIYTNVFANGTGSVENASFDITVTSNLVSDIQLNAGGSSYILNEPLVIPGSEFGGTGSSDISILVTNIYSDDIVITVTNVTTASLFYDNYTKQIFERRLGDKRVSYYDENDILNIDSVYESSGYIPVYSQSLTFPIGYTSFEFWCDGTYSNAGATTNSTTNNIQELVTLFNSSFRSFGYFFDNNDETIGLYINPLLKEQYCPNGVYTINVFGND